MGNDEPFEFFHSRLHLVDVTDDDVLNLGLWLHLSEFEDYVFGVVSQYDRIRSNLATPSAPETLSLSLPQAGLDIYYYVLTWDKLKKIHEKMKTLINRIQKANPSTPKAFGEDYRVWRTRIEHLFGEFDTLVRNEYEHPSLQPYSVGNLAFWGTIQTDGSGDISAHVGKDLFAAIKKEHCERIQALRVDLIDLFLKHFSQKPLTQELLKAKGYIEENIDSVLSELEELRATEDKAAFSELLSTLLWYDVFFMKEGVPLSTVAKAKLYAAVIGKEAQSGT